MYNWVFRRYIDNERRKLNVVDILISGDIIGGVRGVNASIIVDCDFPTAEAE